MSPWCELALNGFMIVESLGQGVYGLKLRVQGRRGGELRSKGSPEGSGFG